MFFIHTLVLCFYVGTFLGVLALVKWALHLFSDLLTLAALDEEEQKGELL